MIIINKAKRTISFGNHENICLYCEMTEGESVDEAINHLETEINKQIAKKEYYIRAEYETERMEEKKTSLQDEINNLEKRKGELLSWAEKHNLPLKIFEDMPF